jgi:hypothetical protein
MNERIYRNPLIEITAIGVDKDQGLFVINDERYIAIQVKNLELISSIINNAITDTKSLQITIFEITDSITEALCSVQIKDGKFVITMDNKEDNITEGLYDSFRLVAFLKSFLLENKKKRRIEQNEV